MSEITPNINNIDVQDICIIIPTYNNADTIEQVISDVAVYSKNIIVVVDGSTDNTQKILSKIPNIEVVMYDNNVGKGWAIRKGFEKALSLGYDYAITIDSDGQHSAADIPSFYAENNKNPNSIIIGSRNIQADGMPSKNTFANKFSNFWFWAETNIKLPDTQSGFRLYPINLYKNTKFYTTKYEFEIEVLVRSAWSDIKIIPLPISVYYPPENERITHFRPLPDFTRISILNTILVLITYLFVLPKKAINYVLNNKFTKVVKEQLLLHNENSTKVAVAMGFGIFMGILPIWGFQMIVAALLAHFFKLNKIIVLTFSNISLPPLVPFIIYFSYLLGGTIMENPMEFTHETLFYLKDQIMSGNFYNTLNEFGYSILQYVIGAIMLGLILGLSTGIISYLLLLITKNNKVKAENAIK